MSEPLTEREARMLTMSLRYMRNILSELYGVNDAAIEVLARKLDALAGTAPPEPSASARIAEEVRALVDRMLRNGESGRIEVHVNGPMRAITPPVIVQVHKQAA